MEEQENSVEEFVDMAWQETLLNFGKIHANKEILFKKIFLKKIQEEYEHMKKMIELSRQIRPEEIIYSSIRKYMMDAYRNRETIEISFSSVGKTPSGNLREALMQTQISEDGIIPFWNERIGNSEREPGYTTTRVILPLDYEFNYEKPKIKRR